MAVDLERLYDEHAQALFTFLLNFTRDETDTRDLLQEIFIKLARQPDLLRVARDERAFLMRLAHNAAIDLMRRRGTREKDVVLEVAKVLAARINQEPGMKAVLTRDGDYFITLPERTRRARKAKADLFVSIHADSIANGDVSGSSVYVLSDRGASSEAARWLAERENAADLKGGVKLDDKDPALANVLLDLSQTASIASSMVAAESVLKALDRTGEVRKPRVQQAGFIVLKSPDTPSMLVETAFISNREDERKLTQPAHRVKLANAIFAGIEQYFQGNAPDGTRLAATRRASGGTTVELR